MLTEKAQANSGMIKTIFIGVILAVVLGMATSQIVTSMPGTSDHTLEITGEGVENIDLGSYKEVDNATTTIEYDFATGDGTADNLTVLLNSATIYNNDNIEGTGTVENDVASYIQEGANTLEVKVEGSNMNSLTTTLEATLNTDVLGVLPTARSMGPTIVTFVFLGLLVLAIVGLIRYFRAV